MRTLVIGMLLFANFIAASQTKVVLKLDDIGAQKNACKALPIMEYLVQRNVKASYGVIANRLDETAKPLLAKITNAVDRKGKPMVEIWNHGLDHSRNGDAFEFKNSSFEQQKKHLDSSHFLVKKYLGISMTTFGAPYNATDSTFIRMIAENKKYRTVFFSKVYPTYEAEFKRLNNNVPMEKETGKPNFDFFMTEYKKHPEYLSSNIVLQGHPPYWTDEGFAEFKKILDFLDTKQCVYVLPSTL